MHRWIGAGLMVLYFSCAPAFADDRPRVIVPTNPDTVLERLPQGYSTLASKAGGSPEQRLEDVNRLLAAAAHTGDARLVTRAGRLASRLPSQQIGVMKAQAYIAQYQHDFAAALRWLDAAVVAAPRDGGARLARSQLHLVGGRLDLARSDCIALVFAIDSGRGQVCLAALALRQGKFNDAIRLSARWLEQSPGDDPLRLYVLSIRAEAAARSGAADANDWMRRAVSYSPGDVRSLVPYARYLRKTGRSRDAVALLKEAPGSDGLQLQATLAAWSARMPGAPELARTMESRYRLARELGVEPELRDVAEFLLVVKGDATAALELAQRNFLTQRDQEDVEILIRAAVGADRTEALAPLRKWAAGQGVPLPELQGAGP